MRKRAGFTQEELAYRLGVDRATVGRWEAGGTTPHPWQQPRLAKALGLSPAELDPLLNETPLRPAEAALLLSGTSRTEEFREEDEWDRRNLLKALGVGVVSASSLGPTRDLVLAAAHTSALLNTSMETCGVSRGVVTHARERLAALATAYALTSDLEPILRDLVVLRNHLAAITATRHHHPRDGRDLYQMMGAACALLASISHDLSEPRAGMIHAVAAATFADLSGDRALAMWVSCTKAMIASWWETPLAVLEHTGKALAANPRGTAAIRLTGLEARALAELGREREAMKAVRVSETQREHVGEYDELRELGEVFTFPSARQHYYNATTFRHLGLWKDVECETNRVADLYAASPSVNAWPVTLTLTRIYQAQARLYLVGPEGARDALTPVFALPPSQRLPQTARALSGVQSALQMKRFVGVPAATDLHEEIVNFQSTAAPAHE